MSATAAERILAVARQQFLTLGFEKCSMDSVARGARVSKQSLYELYPTKRDLFTKVVRDTARSTRDEIALVTVDDRAPEAILRDFLLSYFSGFVTVENLGIYRATLMAGRCFPDLADELHRYRVSGGQALTNYLADLDRKGVIRTNAPADLHRRLGSTTIEGTRYLLGSPIPSLEDREATVDRIIALYLQGYRAGGGRPQPVRAKPPEFPAPNLQTTGASLRLPQQRLDALLEAASTEFLVQGFRGANVTRIVSSVGVSPATVYRQFGDKRGLFLRAVLHIGTSLWSDDAPAPAQGKTLEEALRLLARWTLDRHITPRGVALQRLLITEAEEFPDMARWVYDFMLDRPARELHARLQRFGEPLPDATATRAFHTMATYGVRFIMGAESPDDDTRTTLAKDCVELFLHGCGR